MIELSVLDLCIAASLVCLVALASWLLQLGVQGRLLWSGVRTAAQLTLVGFILEPLFRLGDWYWVALMATVMVLLAGHEVRQRQERPLLGGEGYLAGLLAMGISCTAVCVFALRVVITPEPWYQPRYAIPVLGMLLGNTMTGVALAMDRFTKGAWERRAEIEGRLLLGIGWRDAITPVARDAMRTGLIPIINAMAAAGLVSLPGMMTGQLLGGADPRHAVAYQILIMFLIAAAVGLGVLIGVWFCSRRLTDERERLRLDHLRQPR